MNRCPITYEELDSEFRYSRRGLNKLSRRLASLKPLTLTAGELRSEAGARADKMSIQGVQPKLSAKLNVDEGQFEIVDTGGTYILKPQCDFQELPQNEAITMTMADEASIEVPVHGLISSKDQSFTYFVKRFDRFGKNKKLPLEDFAQLSGESRETKYRSSMEQVARVIERYCTFPKVEYVKLFRRTIFSYLVGNEDMHLKNFSIITRKEKVELSPAYDLVSSTIALPNAIEELAIPLNGKKSKLNQSDFIDYFGVKRLGLASKVIDDVLQKMSEAIPKWQHLISVSFLSDHMKMLYSRLLLERKSILGL